MSKGDTALIRKQNAASAKRRREWTKEGQGCGKTVFMVHDLQNATGNKLLDRLTKVIKGERGLVRVK